VKALIRGRDEKKFTPGLPSVLKGRGEMRDRADIQRDAVGGRRKRARKDYYPKKDRRQRGRRGKKARPFFFPSGGKKAVPQKATGGQKALLKKGRSLGLLPAKKRKEKKKGSAGHGMSITSSEKGRERKVTRKQEGLREEKKEKVRPLARF